MNVARTAARVDGCTDARHPLPHGVTNGEAAYG